MSYSAKGRHDKHCRMVKQQAGVDRENLSAGLSMAQN